MNTICEEVEDVTTSIAGAREAQAKWSSKPISERLHFVSNLRHLIAEQAIGLATAAAAIRQRPVSEKLASEVLPLADACRWLEQRSASVLQARQGGKEGRPFWMSGVSFEVQRQPFGLILVIGPANYPLFLPAVQAMQALVAGNAVLLKPAPATLSVALAFAGLVAAAGLDHRLLVILPVEIESVETALAQEVDKVIFTGSSENGRKVLGKLAPRNTPSVMELSGEDAVLVLGDADLDLVVRAVRFGMRWNGGETCIAPRRIVVIRSSANDLRRHLAQAGLSLTNIQEAADESAALKCVMASRFALGVSIFSRDLAKARRLAARIKSGFVLINDLIVPTADPRMPFGGVKGSGFGVTRGDEGLLEMTFPHVVAIQRSRSHPHLDETRTDPVDLFSAYILAAHGPARRRWGALRRLVEALVDEIKRRNEKK